MHKIILLAAVLLLPPSLAQAQRSSAPKSGKDVVAHKRLAPVVVHKAFPPYGLGIHVYSGRGAAAAAK
jgi:hypothetical protein